MAKNARKWEAKLDGHEFDLEGLPIHFVDRECRVSEKDGAYILTADELEASADHHDAEARAEQLVSTINGVMRTLDSSCRPIRLAHVVGYTDSGQPTQVVSLRSSVELRLSRLNLGGGRTRDPRAQLLIALAGSDSDLGTILREIGDPSVDWGRLYKVFELIEKCAGGEVAKLGWCSQRQRKDFKQTANSPLTAGGRHAVPQGNPQPKMSLVEARGFMRALALKLADHLIAQQSGSGTDGSQ
ncbi:MAG: hypothetical protein OXI76_04870 [Gemmatimonadota bacterium]|nr:hypothetical protein [Gemmatimonadota bacterium]